MGVGAAKGIPASLSTPTPKYRYLHLILGRYKSRSAAYSEQNSALRQRDFNSQETAKSENLRPFKHILAARRFIPAQ
jgi:hypothetical protein